MGRFATATATKSTDTKESNVTATKSEPNVADLANQVERLTALVGRMLESSQPVAVKVVQPAAPPVPSVDLTDLKVWAKSKGIETRGKWTDERIAKVTELMAADLAKSVKPASTSKGRFGRIERPASTSVSSVRPKREDAPGLLANHPFLAQMRTLSAEDWLDLASHGAGERKDKSGKVVRKGLANPTGMTANWRFIAKTMSGTATDRDGDIRVPTANIEFEACNLVQHLVESGKF